MANVDLDISSLKNAIDSLERALAQEKNEFTRDSAIQRFEYTYELCWKFMQRCLQHEYDIDAVTLTKKNFLENVVELVLFKMLKIGSLSTKLATKYHMFTMKRVLKQYIK